RAASYQVHDHVMGYYDPSAGQVHLQWGYPKEEEEGASYRTLVQRYTTTQGWEEGRPYPMDLDTTHHSNRHVGPESEWRDVEGLHPGTLYRYYVFLVKSVTGQATVTVLSKCCDVQIPAAKSNLDKDLIEVP